MRTLLISEQADTAPVKSPIDGLWIADTSYYYPEDRGISESIDFGRMIANDVSKN